MTILFVNPWFGVIGPNIGMEQLAAEARARGHAVHIVAPLCDSFSRALEGRGVRMHYWPDLELTQRWTGPLCLVRHLARSWKVSTRLGGLARQVEADVMCVNGENLLLAPRAGQVAGRPVAVIIRGVRFVELGVVGQAYFGIQQRWVQKYVAISQTTHRALLKVGVPVEQITMVCNGVDTSAYCNGPPKPGLADSLGIPRGSRVVGSIGHLERIKGIHHLIGAFSLLAEQMPDAICLLVGGTDDPNAEAYVESLHTRVAEHGLESRVIFTGYRKDVPDLVRLMDIVVHPSESESFGRSIAEAMASGRPVVGFDVGAVPELIVDGQTGLVVRPFDTAGLAAVIKRLLNDEPLRQQMGRAAQQRVRELYDLKRNVAAAIDILEQLADEFHPSN
jgi:glycosyltransferase involved in cell wall biosynthesis